jgi:putative hydrolase of the HAD superfamily
MLRADRWRDAARMGVRGVFFDLYGTLLAYGDMRVAWDAWLTAFYSGLVAHGLALSREAFALRCDRFFERPEPPDRPDGLTSLEWRIRALCVELRLEMPSDALAIVGGSAADAWQQHVSLDPEAAPVLRVLRRRYILALISNFDHPPHVRKVLSRCGLAQAFDTIVVSAEEGTKKPDPRIFQIALERTGLDPREVVHIGDTDEDIQGASRAAIRPILIRRENGGAGSPVFDFHAIDTGRLDPSASTSGVPVITNLSDLFAVLQS